jgi:hypothetical protein
MGYVVTVMSQPKEYIAALSAVRMESRGIR